MHEHDRMTFAALDKALSNLRLFKSDVSYSIDLETEILWNSAFNSVSDDNEIADASYSIDLETAISLYSYDLDSTSDDQEN